MDHVMKTIVWALLPPRCPRVQDAWIYRRSSFVSHPARFISSGDCTVSYHHFNMKCSPIMYAETERLKGLEGHPASSHNSFSYANARAVHRPLRVWGPSRKADLLRAVLMSTVQCAGFLTVFICSCHISAFEIPVWGKDEGVELCPVDR